MTRSCPVQNRHMIRTILAILTILSGTVAIAQPLDKIVAVVGKNRIVLKSEIDVQVEQMKLQNPSVSEEDMGCDIMEQMLLQKLLVEQAEHDSLLVSPEEVDASLENRIRYYIMQYGSKEKLEEIAGKTVYQLKEENRDVTEEMLMAERMQSKVLDNVKVTPVEVQNFYKNIPADSLPYFPATVELGQIVMDPEVTPQLDSYARQKLERIRKEIVSGKADFEIKAGIESDDPGTRDNGGLIQGMSRKGSGMVPEFVVAAFKLQDGEVSPVFKTKFGYHIIQMVKRKGDEADVRHILIRPERTSADFKRAMEKLDSVRAELIAGKITFEQAVGKYSTDELSNRTGGMIVDQQGSTLLQIDDLDPAVALMVDSLKPGSFSQPMIYVNQRGERSCRIVYMKNITEPHKANLKDDYSRIQSAALQKKKSERIRDWVTQKAPAYYIKLDKEFRQCPNLESYEQEKRQN